MAQQQKGRQRRSSVMVRSHQHARLEEAAREASLATSEALAILDTLETSTSVGLGFIDAQLRIIRLNPALAAVNGGLVEDQLGRHVAEVAPELWGALEPAYRAVLDTSEPLLNQEVAGEIPGDPGRLHYWSTNFYPVEVHGHTTGLCVVAVDITERKESEKAQAALAHTVVAALGAAVETRDPYTAGHQTRVAEIAVAIATQLRLDPSEIDAVDLAARMHDIGKLAVPAEVLARPGRLSPAELALVREHAQAGGDMLERAGLADHVREMVLQHHERLDGSGYPHNLRGDQISTGARIVAVADVMESMNSNRPYRAALSVEDALKELNRGGGTKYDSRVVAACELLLHENRLPPGAGLPARPGRH